MHSLPRAAQGTLHKQPARPRQPNMGEYGEQQPLLKKQAELIDTAVTRVAGLGPECAP